LFRIHTRTVAFDLPLGCGGGGRFSFCAQLSVVFSAAA
jgi:hypothetical protein